MVIIMTIIIIAGGLMNDYQKIMPVTKVKREFLDILKSMEDEDSTVTVTRNGEPVGIMMTPSRYESLLETIEILGDHKIVRALKASQKDFETGRVYPHSEVWQD
jgi:prevent-host-death family protein